MKKNILLIIEITILVLGFSVTSSVAFDTINRFSESSSYENILYVVGTNPGNYTTIQEAINTASEGDTIFVFDDSSPYYENVVIDKSINIIGEDKSTTIIDARCLSHAVLINHNCVNVSGFTFQNATGKYAYVGIYIFKSDNNIIFNTIIQKNKDGICLKKSNNNSICNNFIKSNDWIGIDIEDSSCDNTISGNII